MVRLVFIPSFGTDSTLYDGIKATEIVCYDCLFTEWLSVEKNENMQQYSAKFINKYKLTSEDVVVGVSLGGVLAMEINKIINVKKVVTISSITCTKEHPRIFRFLKSTGGYRLFSPSVLKFGLDLIVPLYGKNISSYMWFRRVFKGSDSAFLKWAFKEIIHWQNEERPHNLIHIHGSRDPLFPLRNASKIDHEIKDGTHAMIRFRAEEIATIIKKELLSL